jgi:hypothetical protein
MSAPEDIVWNTITDSAKTRFDFSSFKASISNFDEGTMAENILFMTIIGHAQNQSIDEIVSRIHSELLLLGLRAENDEISRFVADRLEDLQLEIKAAFQAIAFFDMGLKPPGILVQIRSILQK